ncbi:MAG: delta(1)-pyrroline-2-carboxylate reductase family protein [Acidobacteriota bacterium]
MKIYDAAATAALLPYVPLSEEIADVLVAKSRGELHAPERLSLPLPGGGVLLVMPATDGELAVTKLITVSPGNPALGLPLIQGEVDVMRAATGERLGLLDGPEVTARRTAAASLLAAQRLAPEPQGPLLVVGAGVQALSHAMAFHAGMGLREVFICARDGAKARALAARLREAGVPASSVARPEDVLERAALIVTATNSPDPVIPESVREDAFIAAIGSFSPERAEIPPSLVRRCRLFTDSLEGARTEAGDLVLAGVDWADVTPLENVRGRLDLTGPVLYKAVGCAAFDLAAARLACLGMV